MSCEYVIGIPHSHAYFFFKIRFWNPLIEHRGLICKYHLTPIESVLHLIAQAVSMVMRYQVPPGGRKEGHMPDSLVVTTAAVPLRKYKLVYNRCRFERRGRRIGGIIEKSAHAMTALKPEEFFLMFLAVCSKNPVGFCLAKQSSVLIRF